MKQTPAPPLPWFGKKLKIPFKNKTDYNNLQLASFRRELRSEKAFNPGWQSFDQAAHILFAKQCQSGRRYAMGR